MRASLIAALLAAGSTPAPTPPAAPAASAAVVSPVAPGEAYALALIPSTSQLSDVSVRISVLSGAAILAVGGGAPIPIADATAPPDGPYRLLAYSVVETGGARAWDVYRLNTRTGAYWALVFDGKSSAAWRIVSP